MKYPTIIPTKELVPVFASLFTIARLIETSQVEGVAKEYYLDELNMILEGVTRAADVTKDLINQIQVGIPVHTAKMPGKDGPSVQKDN